MSAHAACKHHLRELGSLQHYRVLDSRGVEGHLRGVVFDPRSWRVGRLVVNADHASAGQFFVPVQAVRLIDDEARRIEVELTERPPLSSQRDLAESLAEAGLGCSHDLIGQEVLGLDAAAGRIADLLVNVDVWQLRYLVIVAGTNTVLTDIEWCVSIGNHNTSPRIDLPAKAVATAPPYHGLDELCIGHEEALYRHYTQRAYVSPEPAA